MQSPTSHPSRYSDPDYLLRWSHNVSRSIDREVVTSRHRLGETPWFSDEGIVDLIDRHPRGELVVATMGNEPSHPSEYRVGDVGGHGGAELLPLIRAGRLTLTLRHLGRHQSRIRPLLERLFGELSESLSDPRLVGGCGHLAISSPSALTYYEFETRHRVLFHLRGHQRVWVYPDGAPFRCDRTVEQMVAGDRVDTIYYEPDFDARAQALTLEPGQFLALPQYTPMRSVNESDLNIVLSTDFATRSSRRRNRIANARGVLRRRVPVNLVGTLGSVAASALAFVPWAKTGDDQARHRVINKSFRMDGQADDCIELNESVGTVPAPIVATLHNTTATAVAMEN